MKILVIDDHPDDLSALKAVVSDRLPATHVLTALNGPQGIELALAQDPDVILLDIGMDGCAVCRKLKHDEHLQMIPVLFLTTLKTDRTSRVQALEAGAEGFLSKPFDEIEWMTQIRTMAKIKAAVLIQRNDQERLTHLVAQRTRAFQDSQDAMLNLLEDLHAENEARKQGELASSNQLEELRRWHAATLGREGRIGALKRELNELAARFGQPLPYATDEQLERQANP